MPDEDEWMVAAAAAVGGRATVAGHAPPASPNAWARHAREDLQTTHTLTQPLARWAPAPVEPASQSAAGDTTPPIAIPEAVLVARHRHRLPEDAICRSPIAGLVTAVMAAAGEPVARLQPVLVIEAMKMENNVTPAVDGVLKAVHVRLGDTVKPGQVLFELA